MPRIGDKAPAGQQFRSIREEIHADLKMINMGGGLPANYLEPADSIS
jgi:diaminopimelate decarboxylase